MILLRTLFSMVSATASLLALRPSGRLLIAFAMPVFTISSSNGMLSKGEILRGSSASM
jgi:hypothetical protein